MIPKVCNPDFILAILQFDGSGASHVAFREGKREWSD